MGIFSWFKKHDTKPKYTVNLLISALSDDDAKTRSNAAWRLGGGGFDERLTDSDLEDPRIIDALISALTDNEQKVRIEAVRSLNKINRHNNYHILESLIALLGDKSNSDEILIEVLYGLQKCHDPKYTAIVIPFLESGNGKIRSNAATVLGELKDPAAAEPLIIALRKEVDVNYIIALGKIGDSRATGILIRLLKKTCSEAYLDHKTPARIADSLANIGDIKAISPLISALSGAREASIGVGHYSEPRINYIEALKKLKAEKAIDTIKNYIKDDNSEVAEAAIKSIEYLQTLSGTVDEDFAEATRNRERLKEKCNEFKIITAKGNIYEIISVIKEKVNLSKGIVTSISGIPDIYDDIKILEGKGIPAVVPVLKEFGDASMIQRWNVIDLKERTAPYIISEAICKWIEDKITH